MPSWFTVTQDEARTVVQYADKPNSEVITMTTPHEDRFIRHKETDRISGLSNTTRWRLEKTGQFPKRRKIGPAASGYLLSEILEWQRTRPEAA